MKDFIENLEEAAEKFFDEMYIPPDHFKCGCGKIEHLDNAQPISNNPYAMPVCNKCFEEWYAELQKKKKIQINRP